MVNTAVDYIRNVDTFAAIQYICSQGDPFMVISLFNDVVGHLYWEDKDLANVIAIGRAGIQYGLAAADEVKIQNPEASTEVLLKVRPITFNVASYCWPGWDEEGIDPSPTDITFGYDAAKTCVRLVGEMDAEPIKFARAFWMLGAYQLALGKSERAMQSFSESAAFASTAESMGDVLLSRAYGLLAQSQAGRDKVSIQEEMEQVKRELSKGEHGPGFIAQIDTVSHVFGIDL